MTEGLHIKMFALKECSTILLQSWYKNDVSYDYWYY